MDVNSSRSSPNNIVTLPFRPRLLDKPPEIKRPEPRDSHDIEHVRAMETPMIRLEVLQRLSVLRERHDKLYVLAMIEDLILDL